MVINEFFYGFLYHDDHQLPWHGATINHAVNSTSSRGVHVLRHLPAPPWASAWQGIASLQHVFFLHKNRHKNTDVTSHEKCRWFNIAMEKPLVKYWVNHRTKRVGASSSQTVGLLEALYIFTIHTYIHIYIYTYLSPKRIKKIERKIDKLLFYLLQDVYIYIYT